MCARMVSRLKKPWSSSILDVADRHEACGFPRLHEGVNARDPSGGISGLGDGQAGRVGDRRDAAGGVGVKGHCDLAARLPQEIAERPIDCDPAVFANRQTPCIAVWSRRPALPADGVKSYVLPGPQRGGGHHAKFIACARLSERQDRGPSGHK